MHRSILLLALCASLSIAEAPPAPLTGDVSTGGHIDLTLTQERFGYIELSGSGLSIVVPSGERVTLDLDKGTVKRSGKITDEEAARAFWEMLARFGAQHAKVTITIGKQ